MCFIIIKCSIFIATLITPLLLQNKIYFGFFNFLDYKYIAIINLLIHQLKKIREPLKINY